MFMNMVMEESRRFHKREKKLRRLEAERITKSRSKCKTKSSKQNSRRNTRTEPNLQKCVCPACGKRLSSWNAVKGHQNSCPVKLQHQRITQNGYRSPNGLKKKNDHNKKNGHKCYESRPQKQRKKRKYDNYEYKDHIPPDEEDIDESLKFDTIYLDSFVIHEYSKCPLKKKGKPCGIANGVKAQALDESGCENQTYDLETLKQKMRQVVNNFISHTNFEKACEMKARTVRDHAARALGVSHREKEFRNTFRIILSEVVQNYTTGDQLYDDEDDAIAG